MRCSLLSKIHSIRSSLLSKIHSLHPMQCSLQCSCFTLHIIPTWPVLTTGMRLWISCFYCRSYQFLYHRFFECFLLIFFCLRLSRSQDFLELLALLDLLLPVFVPRFQRCWPFSIFYFSWPLIQRFSISFRLLLYRFRRHRNHGKE